MKKPDRLMLGAAVGMAAALAGCGKTLAESVSAKSRLQCDHDNASSIARLRVRKAFSATC